MGDNLRTLREQHGLSQEKLCALLQLNSCDIGRSTYAKYEAGELNIPISMITTLRKLYQCTYDDFFVGLESSMEHNEIYRLLGNNISYYRKRANMTQLDLAEKMESAVPT